MRKSIEQHINTCDVCQKHKRNKKKFGLLPPKEAETEPWEKLCVDLIGPYTFEEKRKRTTKLKAVTMIDPATGWFEICEYKDKKAISIANLVEMQWVCRYPWPTQVF